MENNFKKSDALANEEVKELSSTGNSQKRLKNLQDFMIAFCNYTSKTTYNEAFEYLKYLQSNLIISTNGRNLDETFWIDISNLLAPLTNFYNREIGNEEVYIDSFESFLDKKINIISKSIQLASAENCDIIQPYSFGVHYKNKFVWTGSKRDYASVMIDLKEKLGIKTNKEIIDYSNINRIIIQKDNLLYSDIQKANESSLTDIEKTERKDAIMKYIKLHGK